MKQTICEERYARALDSESGKKELATQIRELKRWADTVSYIVKSFD
jgi:hypothetical protein